jgi:hypothetical protein
MDISTTSQDAAKLQGASENKSIVFLDGNPVYICKSKTCVSHVGCTGSPDGSLPQSTPHQS